MTDEEKQNQEKEEVKETGKSVSVAKVVFFVALLLVIIITVAFGFLSARLYSQVSRMNAELKALPNYENRLAALENRLAMLEIESRLVTINNSIADLTKVTAILQEAKAEKAQGISDALASLRRKRERLQQKLREYRENQEKQPPTEEVTIPKPVSSSETAVKEKSLSPEVDDTSPPQSWWQRVINFDFFSSNK